MQPTTFRDLMRIVHGFEPAKILLVANDIELFRHLQQERTSAQLAADLEVDGRALELLLNALTAMGVVTKQGQTFRNAPVADRYLAGDDDRGHIFRHIHHCWDSWNDLAGVLKRGEPAHVREEAMLHDEEILNRDFIRGMDDVTRDLAPEVVGQLDLAGARRLLDVGGGPGTYARAFLETHSELEEVTILDLPKTLTVARERLENDPRRDAIKLMEGDFHTDALGRDFDVVWVSQVFHSQDESGCRLLIDKAWQALAPQGLLIVHEFLLEEDRAAPLQAALFGVHMLVMTRGGRTYSGAEIAAWLAERGFVDCEVRKVSDDTGVVLGRKP